jgi:hypothetical protein
MTRALVSVVWIVVVMDNDGTSIGIQDSADEADATRRIVHAGPIEIDPARRHP